MHSMDTLGDASPNTHLEGAAIVDIMFVAIWVVRVAVCFNLAIQMRSATFGHALQSISAQLLRAPPSGSRCDSIARATEVK